MLKCSICKKELDESLFHPDKTKKRGFRYICKDCYKQYKKDCYNKIYDVENLDKRIKSWAYATLSGHKRDGYIINVSIKEIINMAVITTNCSICNKQLDWFAKNKTENKIGHGCKNTPSLDRINNDIELNINNIQIICKECNSTKRDRTMNEFISYCRNIINIKDGV